MNPLRNYARLYDFVRERISSDIYPEPPSQLHTDISKKMIMELSNLVPLKGAHVLDCGCGQGYALEIFRELGATAVGTTFGEDHAICIKKGLEVYEMDQSFLEFQPKTFDVIWCRHALEHSLFPLFTLRGFFETLKSDGILYLEMPAPDTAARHETNRNHYSCFSKNAWVSLIERSGFTIIKYSDIKFNLSIGEDHYYSFFCKKV